MDTTPLKIKLVYHTSQSGDIEVRADGDGDIVIGDDRIGTRLYFTRPQASALAQRIFALLLTEATEPAQAPSPEPQPAEVL